MHTLDPRTGIEVPGKNVKLLSVCFNPMAAILQGKYAGAAFVTDDSGTMFVVRNGRVELKIPAAQPPDGLPDGRFTTAVQVAENEMALANTNNELILVDLVTLKVRVFQLGPSADRFYAKPLFVNGYLYIGSTDGRLYKVSAQTGVSTSIDLKSPILNSPVLVEGGEIMVANRKGEIYRLTQDLKEGKYDVINVGGLVERNMVRLHGKYLVVSTLDNEAGTQGRFYVIDTGSGGGGGYQAKFSVTSGSSSFIFKNEQLFALVDQSGHGYIVNSKSQKVGSFDTGEQTTYSDPFFLGGNRIFVPTDSSRLAILEFKDSSLGVEPLR